MLFQNCAFVGQVEKPNCNVFRLKTESLKTELFSNVVLKCTYYYIITINNLMSVCRCLLLGFQFCF